MLPDPGVTEFVEDLQSLMQELKFGYFTVGLMKFLEMVATRDAHDITPILIALEETSRK